MKYIEREDYLKQLILTVNTPDIKVITGIRRSGKSSLLEAFKNYVENYVLDSNIIHINFNDVDFETFAEYHALNVYVKDHTIDSKENFLLIDEVQMCSGFEKTINSLHSKGKYHIYITGSNAFLLANDLATLFTGRTFSIEVFPFSFSEYLKYYNPDNKDRAFDDFVTLGGMSGSYLYDSEKLKYQYISDVFETLIIRDVQQKYKIRNMELFRKISDFLTDNISTEVSPRRIANTLTTNKETISNKTVSSYISYLCTSFAFYKVRRYDIKGKKYLASQEKYYLADHAFKYARLGTKNLDYGRMYENIVAIELLRRGYEIYTGILYKKEIDFVAVRQSEKIYIQVSDNISDEQTRERELAPLLSIRDAFPKMIIARTHHPEYTWEGVVIVDIANWLTVDGAL